MPFWNTIDFWRREIVGCGQVLCGNLSSKLAYQQKAHYLTVNWASWMWGTHIPPCRSVITWKIIHGKAVTWNWLQARGFEGPSRCILCGISEITLIICLFTCLYSIFLLNNFFFL